MEITVYSGPGCQACIATRRALDEAGIKYTKIDITEDKASADRLREAGMRSLPVVEIDGKIVWSGFRPDRINVLIEVMT